MARPKKHGNPVKLNLTLDEHAKDVILALAADASLRTGRQVSAGDVVTQWALAAAARKTPLRAGSLGALPHPKPKVTSVVFDGVLHVLQPQVVAGGCVLKPA